MLNQTTNKRFGKFKRTTINDQALASVQGLKDSTDEENKNNIGLDATSSPLHTQSDGHVQKQSKCSQYCNNCLAMCCGRNPPPPNLNYLPTVEGEKRVINVNGVDVTYGSHPSSKGSH